MPQMKMGCGPAVIAGANAGAAAAAAVAAGDDAITAAGAGNAVNILSTKVSSVRLS
jgi:hypothetical protein